MPKTERFAQFAAALALAGLLCGMPAAAQAQGNGAVLSGDSPIEIVSDRLERFEVDQTAIFTGNVALTQDDFLLRTTRMVVHYVNAAGGDSGAAGTQVERIEAEGKVYIKSNDQVATGDRGVFQVASGEMVLTGQEVVLTEGENVIVGCRLTMNTKSGESRVDGCGETGQDTGRVRMLFQPEQQGN